MSYEPDRDRKWEASAGTPLRLITLQQIMREPLPAPTKKGKRVR
mgnify:CR=1 FL=1